MLGLGIDNELSLKVIVAKAGAMSKRERYMSDILSVLIVDEQCSAVGIWKMVFHFIILFVDHTCNGNNVQGIQHV